MNPPTINNNKCNCVDSNLLLIVTLCTDTITKKRRFLIWFLARVVNMLYTLHLPFLNEIKSTLRYKSNNIQE